MGVFAAAAPSASNSSISQPQTGIGSFPMPSTSAGASANNLEASNALSASATMRGDQQAQGVPAQFAAASTISPGVSSQSTEQMTPIAIAFIETVNARLKMADQIQ